MSNVAPALELTLKIFRIAESESFQLISNHRSLTLRQGEPLTSFGPFSFFSLFLFIFWRRIDNEVGSCYVRTYWVNKEEEKKSGIDRGIIAANASERDWSIMSKYIRKSNEKIWDFFTSELYIDNNDLFLFLTNFCLSAQYWWFFFPFNLTLNSSRVDESSKFVRNMWQKLQC